MSTSAPAPRAEAEPAAGRLRCFAESAAPERRQRLDRGTRLSSWRCESAAARMVGGGTHFDRGRDFQPPVLPSQSRRTSHDNRAAPCGSEMEPPTQPRPPASCLPLCPHCAPAPSFRAVQPPTGADRPTAVQPSRSNLPRSLDKPVDPALYWRCSLYGCKG